MLDTLYVILTESVHSYNLLISNIVITTPNTTTTTGLGWLYTFTYWNLLDSLILIIIAISVYLSWTYLFTFNYISTIRLLVTRWLGFEEETGSLDDILFIVVCYIGVFGWLIFFYFMGFFFTLLMTGGVLALVIILITAGFIIPVNMVIDRGLFIVNYMKGASKSSNIVTEFLLDGLSVAIVMIRIGMQNIRIILTLYVYYELFEWAWGATWLDSISFITLTQSFFSGVDTTYSAVTIISLVLAYIKFFFFYFHYFIFFTIQFGAFFLISFWLLLFFYSSFYLTRTEKFLFYQRQFFNKL